MTGGSLSTVFVVGVVASTTFMIMQKKSLGQPGLCAPTWFMCGYSDPTSYKNFVIDKKK